MICYLSRNYRGVDNAGNKAKTDIEQIMESHGFRNVGLKQTRYRNVVVAFCRTLFSVLKSILCLRKGDVLVLQYPLKKYYAFVCNMAHLRGCKVVTLIHDLGSFRRKKLTIPQEIARLDHSDCVIVHSERMRDCCLNMELRPSCRYWRYLIIYPIANLLPAMMCRNHRTASCLSVLCLLIIMISYINRQILPVLMI